MSETKLQTGARFTVHGWVMLKGLPEGRYRVLSIGEHYGAATYTIARERGRKPLCRHFADSVDGWIRPAGHSDFNRIEVL